MKVLVVGSRSIEHFDLSAYMPTDAEMIISGGARGIDTVAEKYADQYGISKLIMRPDYRRFGKAAPLKRNEKMVEAADLVLVIWDGVSRGAKYTAEYAKKKGKEVLVIIPEQ